MSRVRSLDLPLSRLAEIGQRGGVRAFRQEELVLGWTPLPAFDSYAMNVFAPAASVLWNFDVYTAMSYAELTHQAKFLADEGRAKTVKELLNIIQEAGHAKRSDFSSLLLGNWTATPDYFVAWNQSDASFLAHRHRSILVPTEARPSVTEHFFNQAVAFANSCIKPCDDSAALAVIDDIRGTPEWKLLSSSISEISTQSELQELLAKVNELNDGMRFREFTEALDLRFGIRGCISLWMPPASVVSPLVVEDCATLFEFRLKVALGVCSLPQVERLMNEVKSSLDDSETPFPLEFRESMWRSLRNRLRPHLDLISFTF